MKQKNNYMRAFVLVTSLFFLWAIAHSLNDILIKQFQKALDLSRGQAGFVQFSFYLAYIIAAIPAGIAMKRWGFKAAIIVGLLLYATGALLFYPAAEVRSYGFFLISLFIIACGIVFLETAGSAYITLAGEPEKSVQRINFAQSFNGVGAILAPLIGGVFIFSGIEHSSEQINAMTPEVLDSYRAFEASQVQLPYMGVAIVVMLVALAIYFTPFASFHHHYDRKHKKGIAGLFRHRNFIAAIIGQFFYVGAQIGSWSYFIDFTKELTPDTTEKMAAYFLSGSLFAFMTGRFFGTYMMNFMQPRRMLTYYALINIGLVSLAILSGGWVAVLALAATSFFMSIMFPTIYALGLEGLDENVEIGSSLIIMTIISGAIIPPIMGYFSDTASVQLAYCIPLGCFVMVWLSTVWGAEKKIISYEESVT